MVMAHQTNDRYEMISTALHIIDPEGTYLPGTKEHNTITEMILSWMDELEPEEVLRRSEKARRWSLF